MKNKAWTAQAECQLFCLGTKDTVDTTQKRMISSAFCEDETVRFAIRFPRNYGFVEPKMQVNGDTFSGDLRTWCFPMSWDGFDGTFDAYHCDIAAQQLLGEEHSGLFFYQFLISNEVIYAVDEEGFFCECTQDRKNRLLIYARSAPAGEWVRDGIIYHIFVDRFCRSGKVHTQKEGTVLHGDWENDLMDYAQCRGAPVKNNDFFGGDLWGVAQQLPHIASLGTTTIYLSPIFDAASNHKYDTGDYEQVDVMFGGNEALDNLLAQAKKYGIHVILDGVFNHTGDDSKYFNRYAHYPTLGAYQSEQSPFFHWYTFRRFPQEYECWWDIRILPRLNLAQEKCSSYLCKTVGNWTKRGVAGWRLDVADELTDGFIADLKTTIREADGQSVLYGEVWENAADKISYSKRRKYLQGEELDSVMNYPLREAVIAYLLWGDTHRMRHFLWDVYGSYPPFARDRLMNFLGTHDTERILTVLGGESGEGKTPAELARKTMSTQVRSLACKRLKLAWLTVIGLPGVPCVFYGDEAGMEGYHDPFNRRPYPWHQMDLELLQWYQTLGTFRKGNRILMDGTLELLACERHCLVFARTEEAQALFFCINRSEAQCTIVLSSPVRNALVPGENQTQITLSPLSGAVFLSDVDNTIALK